MHNPFKTPTYEDSGIKAYSIRTGFLLILLSIITSYMLTKDFSHLIATYNDSLAKAAKISVFHYIYIKAIPLEIAYFRAFSSIATLGLIIFSARNNHIFSRCYFFAVTYGVTQIIYQALAITGVIAILMQISGRSVLDTDFWLHPTVAPSATEALIKLSLSLVPPLIFIAICTTVKATIKKQNEKYPTAISN